MSGRTSQRAYAELRRLALEQRQTTQQLFELYVHERFLARLAQSQWRQQFVLKGGMLLAVLDARRATRDADLLARGVSNEEDAIRSVIASIAQIGIEDGVSFVADQITIQTIREQADYPGLRVSLPATIGTARLKLTIDISFGDPVIPTEVAYPTLLDDPDFQLLAYPVESVIAEKVESMMFLGDANTRDRDFADVVLLTQIHALDARRLRQAMRDVAEHRRRALRPLAESLRTLGTDRQSPWEAFRTRAGLLTLPERFADIVAAVVAFVDPLLDDREIGRWNPIERRWD